MAEHVNTVFCLVEYFHYRLFKPIIEEILTARINTKLDSWSLTSPSPFSTNMARRVIYLQTLKSVLGHCTQVMHSVTLKSFYMRHVMEPHSDCCFV